MPQNELQPVHEVHLIEEFHQALPKPPLAREELREAIVLSLWAGQLLLQHGAESDRVEETVHRLGTGMGCDWMDILVSPNAVVATTISGGEFRTKLRRVPVLGVNMTIVDAINTLSRQVSRGELNRAQVRTELRRISAIKPRYNRWVVVLMVGLACAAFSRLFGGTWPIFGVTFGSAAIAMFVRQELTRRHFNLLMVVTLTAFVGGLPASSAVLLQLHYDPEITRIPLVASVLLLVPGVPLINAIEDLIKGHMVVGVARGMTGLLISLSIALGLLLAMWVVGVGAL
ncbi:MAG: threonine/serine exporter family protein [Chloroflexaceae bacterium]